MTGLAFLGVLIIATIGFVGYWICVGLRELVLIMGTISRNMSSIVGNTDSIAAQTARIASKPLT